jgi:hypothetical protein
LRTVPDVEQALSWRVFIFHRQEQERRNEDDVLLAKDGAHGRRGEAMRRSLAGSLMLAMAAGMQADMVYPTGSLVTNRTNWPKSKTRNTGTARLRRNAKKGRR